MFQTKVIMTGVRNEAGENLVQYLCHSEDVNDLLFILGSINDDNRYCLNEYNFEQKQCVHIVASENKNPVEKFKLLVLWGADINGKELKEGNTPLHIAVKSKNYELVEWLCQQPNINKGILNNDLMSAYHIAFINQDDRMIDILKKNGVQCSIPLQSESNSSDEDYEPRCESPKYTV